LEFEIKCAFSLSLSLPPFLPLPLILPFRFYFFPFRRFIRQPFAGGNPHAGVRNGAQEFSARCWEVFVAVTGVQETNFFFFFFIVFFNEIKLFLSHSV